MRERGWVWERDGYEGVAAREGGDSGLAGGGGDIRERRGREGRLGKLWWWVRRCNEELRRGRGTRTVA